MPYRMQLFVDISTLLKPLADYAEILLHIKKTLSAEMSPIIVVGASYGGMLAAWFRLKYPHIALGEVASSAPILYFDNITPSNAYYDLVSKDFRDYLEFMYTGAAQYDDPQEYPVNKACEGIDGDSEGTYTLGRIFSGIVALRGENSCHDTCSEMVSPIGIGKNETMFQADPFYLTEYRDSCNKSFGVDIRVVLKRFGSNIIFSNGHRDPCSSAGVLENISDNIIAVTTKNSSHCLDIQPATEDDPEWLVMQRKIEMDMVHDWFLKYSADLLQN
ncbi:hypothetical protein CUMW_253280, partial [Citrus unshiu]